MAVIDQMTSQPLFPSWRVLLTHAAERLEKEQKLPYATLVNSLISIDMPDYLEAARRARDGLGPIWFDFLKGELDHPRARVNDQSLSLARATWALGSRLLITTNYDRVLRWACQKPAT